MNQSGCFLIYYMTENGESEQKVNQSSPKSVMTPKLVSLQSETVKKPDDIHS